MCFPIIVYRYCQPCPNASIAQVEVRSCPIIRFAPAMTTSNTSACEILNTVCTRLSPVRQKWLAFFAATRLALYEPSDRPAGVLLLPGNQVESQQRHGGWERNCRSNGKRLNLKDVSSCQTDEISTMVKNWTAAALRNAGERAKTFFVNS